MSSQSPYRSDEVTRRRSPAKRCPECGLVHPASATRCECGFSFDLDEVVFEPRVRPSATRWHDEPIVAFALLFVCAPIGLALLWSNPKLSDTTKAIAVMVWFALFGLFLAVRLR